MSKFETVQVPMVTLADGRQAITAQSAFEFPWVAEFIAGFPNYFTYDPLIDCWVSPINEPAGEGPRGGGKQNQNYSSSGINAAGDEGGRPR